jgi:cyclopropane fatty-acyl-phospholipid synthase-like methyltransferase
MAIFMVTSAIMPDYEQQAEDFWTGGSAFQRGGAHWLSSGNYSKSQWLAMGQERYDVFKERAQDIPKTSILEWGCGGGSNLAIFRQHFTLYTGVDICRETLDECSKRAEEYGVEFHPVHIGIKDPEKVLQLLGKHDFFLCTAVFQHLPSPEYCVRILNIAHALLNDGCYALIQFRTPHKLKSVRKKRLAMPHDYIDNVARFNLYTVEEFERYVTKTPLQVAGYSGVETSGQLHVWLQRPAPGS